MLHHVLPHELVEALLREPWNELADYAFGDRTPRILHELLCPLDRLRSRKPIGGEPGHGAAIGAGLLKIPVDTSAPTKVVAGVFSTVDGRATRRFSVPALERNRVAFLPLSWTLVHPILEGSPIYGLSEADLRERGAEFMVLLTGIDETFAQTVHARTSYRYDEIVWEARFSDIFERDADAHDLMVDITRIHGIEPAPLPGPRQEAAD